MTNKISFRRDTRDENEWHYYITENGQETKVTRQEWYYRIGEREAKATISEWYKSGGQGRCLYWNDYN